MTLKLGRNPSAPDAVTWDLARFLTPAPVTVPQAFGHYSLIKTWGMNGNDTYGDCVAAGMGHATRLSAAEGGKQVAISTTASLKLYAAINGHPYPIPGGAGGPDDQGTDMGTAAKYWQKTGVFDSKGARHKIDSYLSVKHTDLNEVALATYIVGSLFIGIQFPSSAMDQFNAGQPWDVVKGASIEGGHCILLVGKLANGNWLAITWGKLIQVTPAFLTKYMDEAIAAISLEAFKNGVSPEKLSVAQIEHALAA